ncbi:TM0106 family RecB-like putative nuclease [Rhizobium ruizarguesonis]|uniref:TM0106 family RecB-like putative nuclease n=1 Tax=Rhizobium ruizarguesonis TaxID=2081791 RepID=UPI00102FDC72|nr:TM0106 family RecB-like putative nuclease [Rhizobium ruizarguesonis]TAZ88216.1 TM0106 family RecB-like putative nuclease [Rhizobium ruizarguesonis]TBA30179.1 TM0106 family RecB-like putative nuclease [Rhizobium ruizarguesonis]TBA74047.1 TM0106 family RecB-like putative nuclease [Rhizobium ruizarguesonis]TBC54487.1 TM0106 family RecB-like putative nuclease [Rhizobium ruizarguesonis]
MRDVGGSILFSASDLMRFMGCAHAITLDLAYLRGEGPEPREDSEDAALLQKQGDTHEAAHLARLNAAGRNVVEIARGNLAANVETTCAALAAGAEVVFQGALLSGNWGGWSDFLERVDRRSALGNFSYEVADTKLKRRPHPKHVLQLVLYSDLLSKIQGVTPEFAHIELGDGNRATLRLADYAAYARLARERLEAFVADPRPTRPVPCADCGLCRWADHCDSVWRAEDSLFNVANIARGQVKKLEEAGITTMAALAAQDGPVRGMATETLGKLRTQARLQHARKTGEPRFELRPTQAGKGFDLLPEPQPGDLFYDIEGDPHYEGGLEYLHGVWFDGQFRSFWAHDHEAESQAVAELFDFFRARLAEYPEARIYHYAPYEITALKRLTTKYGIGEAFLDRLLRERRFVDLYAVVRGGFIASELNYSIKSLEAFYGLKREGEVKTAGGSVVAYENWRETGEQQILDEIEEYNRIDCLSTEMLRGWLVSIRPDGPWPLIGEDAGAKEIEEDAEIAALRARLAASDLPEDRQAMLFNLGLFHKREAKPAWWSIFDSLGKEEDDLIDDLDALGGLVATGPAEPVKQSVQRSYRFPPQETKLRGGRKATIPTPDSMASVSIEAFDSALRMITLKIGSAKAELLTDRLTLHPDKPIGTDVIAAALQDVILDQCGPRHYRAVNDLLSRAPPRLKGDGPIMAGDDPVAGTIAAVHRMDETLLPIQGPPGTGKTHVTARAILSLVRDGARIGIASNSHEAIRNVLLGCLKALDGMELPITIDLVHKISGDDDGYAEDCAIRRTSDNAEASNGGHVVGGTAFFFAREENIQAFDWLFVDEAGQVGLANMAAMGRAAKNIVLVGDPRQLAQVIQGAHPEPANLSCLDWMLGARATVPLDRGIFLATTRRMHRDVNRFISEQVYEGRLVSHPDTARQALTGTRFPEAGAFWVPVAHEGNAQVAMEEVEAIGATCANLLTGRWTDKEGITRSMRHSDIIVVAPYNAQVNALRDALHDGIRVGTVDKFQGQEAPVCLVSMTASSAEETSRGMEFLFALNRINVAVSRAKGLALVFGAPRLRETKCDAVEQMRLVNALCALKSIT